MRILIVGIGALGGTIAERAIHTGLPVRLAARNTDSAKALRRSGLRVSGIGGEVRADAIDVAAVEDYGKGDQFDLILLAGRPGSSAPCIGPACGRRDHIAYTEWRRCSDACGSFRRR